MKKQQKCRDSEGLSRKITEEGREPYVGLAHVERIMRLRRQVAEACVMVALLEELGERNSVLPKSRPPWLLKDKL